jgi:hypothetical protein
MIPFIGSFFIYYNYKESMIMSKMTTAVKENRANAKNVKANAVTNFMGGTSYTLNPIETLRIVTASSIMGEPQYYRCGEFAEARVSDGTVACDRLFAKYLVLDKSLYSEEKTSTVMERVIDAALDFDFDATIDWALKLRKEYFMRLNPQVIMVRAAMHPKRAEYTAEHPRKFAVVNAQVMSRADEPASQLTYYLFKNGSKNKTPNILKRSWASRIECMTAREIYKYRNAGIGLIDTVRVCHANNEYVNELMQTGSIAIPEDEKTWEALHASGKSWVEILSTIRMGHMALLRNLRGIFTEVNDFDFCKRIMEQLKKGVVHGKQFPFRYKTAYDVIKASNVNHKRLILDTLEECMDIACDNMPKLHGRTCCLSDNSGSAWGTFNSEYGSVTVANIDNLSSVITARNSDEGYVGKFGDDLHMFSVSHREGVLSQTNKVDNQYHVGGNTENGIWMFFDKAIKNKEHWDNIFIYSDMQAGHGGLYGINPHEYRDYTCGYRNIDVAKLIDVYRKQVNSKVNVFCVQTAGYDNVLVPETGYRTSILTGWTGKELVYADAINKLWDEFDQNHQ